MLGPKIQRFTALLTGPTFHQIEQQSRQTLQLCPRLPFHSTYIPHNPLPSPLSLPCSAPSVPLLLDHRSHVASDTLGNVRILLYLCCLQGRSTACHAEHALILSLRLQRCRHPPHASRCNAKANPCTHIHRHHHWRVPLGVQRQYNLVWLVRRWAQEGEVRGLHVVVEELGHTHTTCTRIRNACTSRPHTKAQTLACGTQESTHRL